MNDITDGKIALTVTADNKGKNYGETFSDFTATITGAVNGDTFTVPMTSTGSAATAAATTHPIAVGTVTGANLGNYTLTSIGGKSLPYTMYSDTGYSVVVTGGTLSLATSRHFDIATSSTETFAGSSTLYVDRTSGNWTTTNGSSSVTLTPVVGAVLPAVWSGTKLTVTQPDGVFQYTRAP